MVQFIVNGLILRPAELFDWQAVFEQLDYSGHPLLTLNQIVNWQRFSHLNPQGAERRFALQVEIKAEIQ